LEKDEYVLASEQDPVRKVCVKNQLGFPVAGKLRVNIGYPHMHEDLPMDVQTADVRSHP